LQAQASEKASWEEAMFNSAVLDLAIGLIFCFLTVSLATGTIVEAIASLFAIRARTLRKGIGQLVNDSSFKGLAKEIYAHALVNPRGDGTDASAGAGKRKNPAYIDRQLFGQAMLDILKISPEVANAANDPTAPLGKPTVDALKKAVKGALKPASTPQAAPTAQDKAPDDQLQKLLYGIIERSLGDPDKIKGELVAWFDNGMDRVSGWYKRWTQLIGLLAALILAAGLNINVIGVAEALWTQPKLAQELDLPKALPAGDEAEAPALLHQLDTTLPVGWPHGVFLDKNSAWIGWSAFWLAFLGWLITALSTLFGAPFWFDLLQTVIRLKGSGPSPVEKVAGKGASA
jgi:hypothetical protein